MSKQQRGNATMHIFGGRMLAMAVAVFTLGSASAYAQQRAQPSPLNLAQAVSIAMETNPGRKAEMANTRSASAGIREARAALLPHVMFSETFTRGNDPVFVFGTKLRQRRFGTSDFALNALNTPTPIGNFATRFGGTWRLFDSLGSWRGVSRAEKVREAAGHHLERTDQELIFRVVDAYYGLLLAGKHLEVAEQSMKTALANLDLATARAESGVTVESDRMSAQVQMSARQQDAIRARNQLALARAQLSLVLGVSADTAFEPAEALAERIFPEMPLEELDKQALENRPDLKRMRSEEAAQHLSVLVAKSSFGPRVNGFAGWEADNPAMFGGGGNNWLAGVEVQFDLFQGGAKRAQLSREQAGQERIEALRQAASDGIRLEVRRAYYEADTARRQIEIARGAVTQAQESMRINSDRYQSGLATITAVLAAEEAVRRSQGDYWGAVYRYHTGYAGLQLASGVLNPNSPVVTQ